MEPWNRLFWSGFGSQKVAFLAWRRRFFKIQNEASKSPVLKRVWVSKSGIFVVVSSFFQNSKWSLEIASYDAGWDVKKRALNKKFKPIIVSLPQGKGFVVQKRLQLSRKLLICQNVCPSLYLLTFVFEIHLYIGCKLVWKRNSTQRKKQDFVLEKKQKDNKNANAKGWVYGPLNHRY